MWNKKFVYVLNHLKFSSQCPKAINVRTRCNKIKKPCWLQQAISKSLLLQDRRDNNRALFTFVYQKDCSWYETGKVNTTIEFCILELVWAPNFSSKWQFWFFGPILPKKYVSGLKQKTSITTLNFAYSN